LLFRADRSMAQEDRRCHLIYYDMEYQYDSRNKDSMVKEKMELHTDGSQSLFMSYEYSIIDSTRSELRPKRVNNILTRISSYCIHKNFDLSQIVFSAEIRVRNPYVYYENMMDNMQWQITTEIDTVHGYFCQKVYLDYGRRRWVAWFAPQIPIFDGPYKFCNLPGLIVSVRDTTGSWRFDIVSISETPRFPEDLKNFRLKAEKPEKIEKEQFYALKKNYRDNMVEIEEASGKSIFIIDSPEKRVAVIKMRAEAAKRDNNWIEPYP